MFHRTGSLEGVLCLCLFSDSVLLGCTAASTLPRSCFCKLALTQRYFESYSVIARR